MGRATTSLCPDCFRDLPAEYVEDDGAVRLVRTCPDHGRTAPVVWRDADHFRWTEGFEPTAPDGGLDVVHDHACLVVLDVTTRCNLECDYCFAASGPDGQDLPLDRVEELLDTVVAGGGPRPLQLSGGEPTVHPQLVPIVEAARDRGFDHVEVNSNGILLAEDGLAARLADAGVTAVYLQFDALDGDPVERMRGGDLVRTKREAIRRCREAGIPVVLACTVVEGVNDDALGDVLRFGLDTPGVRAVNFQPLARFGRYAGTPSRLSLDAVARRLADQTSFLEPRDLLPVPCCSPRCQAATVLLPGDEDPVPVTRYVDEETWIAAGPDVDESSWMEVLAGTDRGRDPEFLASCCGIEVPGAVRGLLDDAFPVGLVGFMDAGSADLDTLQSCCIAVPTDDGLVPFCAYNMTDRNGRYRFRDRHGWDGRSGVD